VKVVDLGRQSVVLIVDQSQSFNFSPGSDALVELEWKKITIQKKQINFELMRRAWE
jgi:hypothetical protein